MRKGKLLAWGLAFCLGVSGVWYFSDSALAAEPQTDKLQNEYVSGQDHITSMDDEGNITDADSSAKLIENPAGPKKTRSGEPQVVNFRTKNNEITEFIEQETANPGYTNGAYGADAVYLGSANGKYKFMLSGVVGWVKEDEVQVVNLSQVKAVSCYEVKDGKLLHHIVQDMTTPGYATSLNNGPAPSYLEPGTVYYSYDGHYFYTHYGVMVQDYRADQRTNSVNPQEAYYNYFQYLPMRSKSAYTAEELNKALDTIVKPDSKMKSIGEALVKNQNTYGVQGLLMAGIAANESNWGKSSISQKKNNLFGLNATDAAPGENASQYSSVEACIKDFAKGWISEGYLYPEDYRYHGGFLGNKASGLNVKYASDPYWGEKAANIVWRLDSAMGEKDANAHTLAVKEMIPGKHLSVNVRKERNASSTRLYKTGKAANYVVLLREEEPQEGFYEIQSDAVLDKGRNTVVKKNGAYHFDAMYAYMSADYLTVVSTKQTGEEQQEQPPQKPENEGENIPAEKTLDSIKIVNPPVKTVYTEGEAFAAEGMKVMAKWSDGTENDISTEIMYSQKPLQLSDTELRIQYTYGVVTKEAIQKITVSQKEEIKPAALFVTPDTVELKPGESQQFQAEIKNQEMSELLWEVLGKQSAQTVVDSNGKLTLGQDETADKLLVRVSLKADASITADAMITLMKSPELEGSGEDSRVENPEVPQQEKTETGEETPEAPRSEESKEPYVEGQKIEGQKAEKQSVQKDSEKVNGRSVKTGDNLQTGFWILLLSVSGLIGAGAYQSRKKK
ncbi:N-acetylglucosaminidase [Blautia sp.]|uniref:N-acetylglucosaminidase n=1 Tax=Blautia sp. TaxID=1955243 RepID=UPI002584ACF6|nr:glucosaminidase domain-containing protein [Blautia sp.]